jgi:hypothetical protein
MAHHIFMLRQGIRTQLGLQLNRSNEDYVTFGEIDDASTALFDVAILQFAIHPMPNPAWDDPLTSHVFHPPLYAPTPSTPYFEDLTRAADALQQIIEAVENMENDPDDDLGIFHLQKVETSTVCPDPGLNPQGGQRISQGMLPYVRHRRVSESRDHRWIRSHAQRPGCTSGLDATVKHPSLES